MGLAVPDIFRRHESNNGGPGGKSRPPLKYTPREIADIHSYSVNETSRFISENLNTTTPLPVDKARIMGPIDAVVELEKNRAVGNLKDLRPTVDLDDFAKGNRDLDMLSLQEKIRRDIIIPSVEEDSELVAATQQNLLRQGVVRVLESAIQIRSEDVGMYDIKINEKTDGDLLINGRRTKLLLREMMGAGVDNVAFYYKTIEEIQKARNGTEIDVSVEDWKEKIKFFPSALMQDQIRARLENIAEQRKKAIHANTMIELKKMKELPIEERAKQFMEYFNRAYDDFEYFTPKEMKSILHGMPKVVLDLMYKGRRLANWLNKSIAAPYELAGEFWIDRTGRRARYDTFKAREATIVDLHDRTHYEKRIADKFLKSEASGFEIEEQIRISKEAQPSALVMQSMKKLLEQHRPKGQEKVFFTLLFGENTIRKVKVDLYDGIDEVALLKNIENGLKGSVNVAVTNIDKTPLTTEQRVALSYTGYSPNRVNDSNYRHIYGHLKDESLIGDYLIQIKTPSPPTLESVMSNTTSEHDPESLFAVDSHKAALLIDMRSQMHGETTKTIIRYNHTEFDGVQAAKHAKKILTGLTESILPEPILLDIANSTSENVQSDGNVYPHFEGHATYVDKDIYPKLVIDVKGRAKPIVLSPTFTRSFILALANDIDFYHHLHVGDKSRSEFFEKYGDRFDDVQAIITSFNHLKTEYVKWQSEQSTLITDDVGLERVEAKIKQIQSGVDSIQSPQRKQEVVEEWFSRFNNGKARAELSHSDVALFAGIPGQRFEEVMYKLGLKFTTGAKMIKYPGSMFSPLFYVDKDNPEYTRQLTFRTAQSDSYASQEIDLEHAEKSMGVIGYIQEGTSAVYTSRKLPSQAQVEFKKAVTNDILPRDASPEMTAKTLKEFTTIIKSWDSLLKGSIELSDYMEVRDSSFKKLQNEDVCGVDVLLSHDISDPNSLQTFLNNTLTHAAEETFNRAKLENAKKQFEAFLKAQGVGVIYKEESKTT